MASPGDVTKRICVLERILRFRTPTIGFQVGFLHVFFLKIPIDFRPYLTPLFPHIFPSTVESFILFP